MNKKRKCIVLAVLIVVIDQTLKYFVRKNLSFLEVVPLIKNFFSLTYVQNTGGAWSILEGNSILFIGVSILFLGVLFYYFRSEKELSMFSFLSYSFLIGGIAGNLIDRVFFQYVIDFLSFRIFGYYFPVFNFADIFIVVGTILCGMEFLKTERTFSKKK